MSPRSPARLGEAAGGPVEPVLEAARLAVTLRRTRAEPPRPPARVGRPRPAAALRALPVHPRPRPAGHPPGGRGPRRGAGLLMPRRRARTGAHARAAAGGQGDRHLLRVRAAWARRRPRPRPRRWPPRRLGGKVLVLTVDPARRLANALGLEGFGNVEKPVPRRGVQAGRGRARGASCGRPCSTPSSRGTPWCSGTRPTRSPRGASSRTRSTRTSSGRFVQSHEYIAMERLYEIHTAGTYDLIVVDTPPTRNAIDFLEAPERMADFFSSRLLRWLTVPGPLPRHELRHPALLPDGRPHPRLAVPRGHRRVLPALPDDVRRASSSGPRPSRACSTTGARPSWW